MTDPILPDINRNIGILSMTEECFRLYIERGFPVPRGTIVRDVRKLEWEHQWQLLLCHPTMRLLSEGDNIPKYILLVHTNGTGKTEFGEFHELPPDKERSE